MEKLQFLLLEDSPLDADLIQITLNGSNLDYELQWVQTRDSFLKALETHQFDLILSDYSLPSFDGISALEIAHRDCPEIPFIFVSATLGEEVAIETLKNGATDYVLKQRLGRLVPSVQRALREARERHDRKQAEQALQEHNKRLNLLFETTRDLLSTEQPLILINNLFTRLSAQMELDCYLNFVVDESGDRQQLRLASYAGIPEETAKDLEQINVGQTLCGQVAQNRCQIVVNNLQHSLFPNAETLRSIGLTAYAGQILMVQRRILGTLSFGSRSRLSFTPEEVALLKSTSDQVAMMLDRANLVGSLQQQTEQLSQANRIKDEFLAVLSHELRTPLNPILGWASILRSQQVDESTTARALEIIERNAKIQIQLIEDLLDVSRILRGKVSLNMIPVDLATIVEAALETVRLAAEAKSIDLRFETADCRLKNLSNGSESAPLNSQSPNSPLPTPSLQVLGDPNRLQQIIWNLLSNAVKFTPMGGRVHVTLSTIIVQEDRLTAGGSANEHGPVPDNVSPEVYYAQVEVHDTGKGISPQFLPHVFDYFRQADGSTTRTFGGLGLGLAIAHHLIQVHGGTIQAESPGEEQGATFKVRIPLFSGSRQATVGSHSVTPPSPLPASQVPLQGLRILIIDDEQDTLDFIRFLLEQYGGVVKPAKSINEGFLAFEQFQPDVVVSDIAMPGGDGYEFLRKVRALEAERGGHVPAIALTAYARDEDHDRALEAGFQRYISKPIKPSDLVAVVAEVAGRFTGG